MWICWEIQTFAEICCLHLRAGVFQNVEINPRVHTALVTNRSASIYEAIVAGSLGTSHQLGGKKTTEAQAES
jgi:hypothetical protein